MVKSTLTRVRQILPIIISIRRENSCRNIIIEALFSNRIPMILPERSDEIFRRDFSAPMGDDKMDKIILLKVMQVKNFGRRGRTKWTHLVNEDTSDLNSLLSYNRPLSMRHNARTGGMDKPISRPKGNKKLKEWEF